MRRGGEGLPLAGAGLGDSRRQGEGKLSFEEGVKGEFDRSVVLRGEGLDRTGLLALTLNPHTSME